MPKKILILNTHSSLNAGDASIVLAQARFLRRFFGQVSIALTSRTPDLDRKAYAAEGLEVLGPLFSAPSVYSGFRAKVRGSLKGLVSPKARQELRRAAREADLIIASGGGYFWSSRRAIPGPMFMQNIMHLRLAARSGRPVVVFPQSFGPLFSPLQARTLRNTLEHGSIHAIFAREQSSAGYLHRLLWDKAARSKVQICPDMAFLLEPGPARVRPDPPAGKPSGPVLALTLRHWDFPGIRGGAARRAQRQRYLDEIEHFCEHIILDWKGSVRVFPQSRGPGRFEDDRSISLSFESKAGRSMPRADIRYVPGDDSAGLESALDVLSGADLVLATRLHSAILGFNRGLPALAIAYQPKTSATMKLLGLERFAFGIECFSAADLLAGAHAILSDPAGYRNRIRSAVARIRKDIEEKIGDALRPFR
jgi:colanic acid/amylovoran biosynthesis protein